MGEYGDRKNEGETEKKMYILGLEALMRERERRVQSKSMTEEGQRYFFLVVKYIMRSTVSNI